MGLLIEIIILIKLQLAMISEKTELDPDLLQNNGCVIWMFLNFMLNLTIFRRIRKIAQSDY